MLTWHSVRSSCSRCRCWASCLRWWPRCLVTGRCFQTLVRWRCWLLLATCRRLPGGLARGGDTGCVALCSCVLCVVGDNVYDPETYTNTTHCVGMCHACCQCGLGVDLVQPKHIDTYDMHCTARLGVVRVYFSRAGLADLSTHASWAVSHCQGWCGGADTSRDAAGGTFCWARCAVCVCVGGWVCVHVCVCVCVTPVPI